MIAKQSYGDAYSWDDGMNFHLPLATSDGHLGYYDPGVTSTMQAQIDAAADYGVDFFAYELFWNLAGIDQKKFPRSPSILRS